MDREKVPRQDGRKQKTAKPKVKTESTERARAEPALSMSEGARNSISRAAIEVIIMTLMNCVRAGTSSAHCATRNRISTAKCFRGKTFSTDGGGVPGLCVWPQTRWKNKGGVEENQISAPLMGWLSCAPHFLINSHGDLRTRESPIHLLTCNV